MVNYPLEIESKSSAASGIQSSWSSQAGSFGPLEIAIPREFDGPNTGYSPEDLFALALINCFVATFKVVAEKSSLAFQALEGQCKMSIDRAKADRGVVRVTRVNFHFALTGSPDRSRAERLLRQTSQSCILINSIKAPVHFDFHVSLPN